MSTRRPPDERDALSAWPIVEPPASFVDDVLARLDDEMAAKSVEVDGVVEMIVPDQSEHAGSAWGGWIGRAAAVLALSGAIGAGAWIGSRREPPAAGPTSPVASDPASMTASPPALTMTESEPIAEPLSSTIGAEIKAYVEQFGRHYGPAFRYQGIVAVARGDDAHVFGFGETTLGNGEHPQAHTRFRLGTLTQQFVAVAMLRFVERGRISLDDTLYAVLPSYPNAETARRITVRQLLSHTSGLPNVNDFDPYWERRCEAHDRADLLDYFAHGPLTFAPGTAFEASNSNYIVLGMILERLGGGELDRVLATEIFEPAGMVQTSLRDEGPTASGGTTGYEFSETERLVPARLVDLSAIRGAGAAVSTAHDMIAWHRALLDDTLLSAEMRRLMHRPVQRDFGLGWVLSEVVDRRTYGHPGGTPGYNADILRFADGTLVLALANTQAVDCRAVAEGVAALVYGETPAPVIEQIEVPLPRAARRPFAGHYRLSAASRERYRHLPTSELAAMEQVEVEFDERLWFVVAGHGRKWMHYEGEDRFFFKDYPRSTAVFERDDVGDVVHLRVSDRVREFVLTRVR